MASTHPNNELTIDQKQPDGKKLGRKKVRFFALRYQWSHGVTDLDDVISWLMEGDPAIRWQTMRDLAGAPEEEWQAERRRTAHTGWGAQFVACRLADGTWPAGRWSDTVWTLLTLMDCGIPPDYGPVRESAQRFLDRNLTVEHSLDERWVKTRIDLCHLGFWLRIGAYFLGKENRLVNLANAVIGMQMADGGWNCRVRTDPGTRHGSFHTTLNVLEGVAAAAACGIVKTDAFRQSESRAIEFMLAHQLYRSDRTGEVIQERFTHLTYPSHWHYTVLRGLDYLRTHPSITDTMLVDPIALIESRRSPTGRWLVEKRIPGIVHFDMERFGGESRWITLMAMRVLRCRTI